MIDYVNKENMESVRGIENPGMMGEMGKIIGRRLKKSGKRKQKCCWMR